MLLGVAVWGGGPHPVTHERWHRRATSRRVRVPCRDWMVLEESSKLLKRLSHRLWVVQFGFATCMTYSTSLTLGDQQSLEGEP